MTWRALGDLPFDEQPIRQLVYAEGCRTHHGDTWKRAYVDVAYIERDGPQGYREADIRRIEADGDFDPGTAMVVAWQAFIAPFPTRDKGDNA